MSYAASFQRSVDVGSKSYLSSDRSNPHPSQPQLADRLSEYLSQFLSRMLFSWPISTRPEKTPFFPFSLPLAGREAAIQMAM
jgi:hypothetical protein